jgi:hypothetical protein
MSDEEDRRHRAEQAEYYAYTLKIYDFIDSCTPADDLMAMSLKHYMNMCRLFDEIQVFYQTEKTSTSFTVQALLAQNHTFFVADFPRYVQKFHADNVYWAERALVLEDPASFLPDRVVSIQYPSRYKDYRISNWANHPFMIDGKMHVTDWEHLRTMLKIDWLQSTNLVPEVSDMLTALTHLNDASIEESRKDSTGRVGASSETTTCTLHMLPIEISDGKLLIGGHQTDAFEPDTFESEYDPSWMLECFSGLEDTMPYF